jgi:hypothetical protein
LTQSSREGFFGKVKTSFHSILKSKIVIFVYFHQALTRTRRTPKIGDGDPGLVRSVQGMWNAHLPTPCADLSRPVEELKSTCPLKSTFTQASHDRDLKT